MKKQFVVCFLLSPDLKNTLLMFKEKKIFKGRYNGLGGRVEPNETPKQAIIREVYEESLGVIKLENPKHISSITFPISDEVPLNNGVTLHAYYDIVKYNIKLATGKEEGGRVEWKPIEFAMDINNPQLGGDGDLPYYHHMAIKNEEILRNKTQERNDKGLWFKE